MMDFGSIPALVYLVAAALVVAAFIHYVLPKLRRGNAAVVGPADVHQVLSTIAGHLGTIVQNAAAPAPVAAAAATAPATPAQILSAMSQSPVQASELKRVTDPMEDDDLLLCPKTGHKVPPPNTGEGLVSYYVRVSPLIGGHGLADAGGLALMQSSLHTVNDGDPAKWPFIVDEYVNREAYLTDAEKADAAALLARDQAAANRQLTGVYPVAAMTLPDALYLSNKSGAYRTATGRDIWEDMLYGPWLEVRRWINEGSGTQSSAETAPIIAAFNPETYAGPLRVLVERRMNGG